jgi:hypothetical protein
LVKLAQHGTQLNWMHTLLADVLADVQWVLEQVLLERTGGTLIETHWKLCDGEHAVTPFALWEAV